MRASAALSVLAAAGLLAGCVNDSRPVAASPPTVSYRIAGNDVSQANANAARYCQRYGAGPQLQTVQQGPSGNVAVYTCDGVLGSAAGTVAPPPAYAAPAPGYAQPGYGNTVPLSVQCADPWHQDRPGGTDYQGPPVSECPTRR